MNLLMPQWFESYVQVMVKCFGNRVNHYMTFNEPQCFIGISTMNTQAEHAPGVHLTDQDNVVLGHNMLLAHGKAVQVIRKENPSAKVGWAPCGASHYPATDTPEDIKATEEVLFDLSPEMWNGGFSHSWWSDPVLVGEYPQSGLSFL